MLMFYIVIYLHSSVSSQSAALLIYCMSFSAFDAETHTNFLLFVQNYTKYVDIDVQMKGATHPDSSTSQNYTFILQREDMILGRS